MTLYLNQLVYVQSNYFDLPCHVLCKRFFCDWFRTNKLLLNVLKTNVVLFAPKITSQVNDITSIRLGDEIIPRVDHAKFLGIYIDELLEWGYHIYHIRKKLPVVYMQSILRKDICPVENLKSLYFCSLLFIVWSNDLELCLSV